MPIAHTMGRREGTRVVQTQTPYQTHTPSSGMITPTGDSGEESPDIAAPRSGRPAVATVPVTDLDNGSLVLRLSFTINHLSRWLSPIHDPAPLLRATRRGEPSVMGLLLEMRDEERRVFPKLHQISVQTNPDLDRLPPFALTAAELAHDRQRIPLEVMAEFRRLRQSTCSLLRSLVDAAWERPGTSRQGHNWTIRTLAEHLAAHDLTLLADMDTTLDRSGAREGIAAISRVPLAEMLTLVPVRTRHGR